MPRKKATTEIPEPQKQQLRRNVLAIYEGELEKWREKRGRYGEPTQAEERAMVNRAFAIAVRNLQRYGYIESGSTRPTPRGRLRGLEKASEPGALERHQQYEAMLQRARIKRVDIEPLLEREQRRLAVGQQRRVAPPPSRSTTQPSGGGFDLFAAIARQEERRGGRNAAQGQAPIAFPSMRKDTIEQTLQPLRDAMEAVFTCRTAFGTCRPQAPSAGHCIIAAMVVQDLFGGDLVEGKVGEIPHYWNRIGGYDIDITGDQFGQPEVRVKRGKLNGGGRLFKRSPGEQLNQSYNAEVCGKHDSFVMALLPELRRQGLEDYVRHIARCILEDVA